MTFEKEPKKPTKKGRSLAYQTARQRKERDKKELLKKRLSDNRKFISQMYADLFGYVLRWNEVLKKKDDIPLLSLNKRYRQFGRKYLKKRKLYHKIILSDKSLYTETKRFAGDDLTFDILIDGWSYDINRAGKGQDPTMPFIPFPHQLPLIKAFEDPTKHIHVEKSRRQGATVLAKHNMKHDLIHGVNVFAIATHKDLASLDGQAKDRAKNSTFEGVRWLLDNSIFLVPDWQNEKKYWHRTDKKKQKYYSGQKQIIIGNNTLDGTVLGKGTNVGSASTKIYTDEIDVVSDLYPVAMEGVLGSFAMSVNQVIAYSTYRSNEYSFYEIKQQHDTTQWNFIEMDWRDNPICNNEWYEAQKARLGQDEVLIARELDRDPTKSRRGLILPEMDKERHQIDFSLLDRKRLTQVVGADFGGGTSNTVFIAGWYDNITGNLYMEHMLKGTRFESGDVSTWMHEVGFGDAVVYGDSSALNETTLKDSSWAKILYEEGVKFEPVDNKDTIYYHGHMNNSFRHNKTFISRANDQLWKDLSSANYKLGKVNKDVNSHTFDAFLYLFKALRYNLTSEISLPYQI